jgi:hypothetical protein
MESRHVNYLWGGTSKRAKQRKSLSNRLKLKCTKIYSTKERSRDESSFIPVQH